MLEEGQRSSGEPRRKRGKAAMTNELGDPGKAEECQISPNLPARAPSRGEVDERIEPTPAQAGKNFQHLSSTLPNRARLVHHHFVKQHPLRQEVAHRNVAL